MKVSENGGFSYDLAVSDALARLKNRGIGAAWPEGKAVTCVVDRVFANGRSYEGRKLVDCDITLIVKGAGGKAVKGESSTRPCPTVLANALAREKLVGRPACIVYRGKAKTKAGRTANIFDVTRLAVTL